MLTTLRLAGVVLFGLALDACGDSSRGGAGTSYEVPDAGADAGATFQQCVHHDDCPQHNQLCLLTPGMAVRSCQAPTTAECMPGDAPMGVDVLGCYPGARCQPVTADLSRSGGLCSFQGPRAPAFELDPTTPKISLTEPNALLRYAPTQALTLRWTRPALPADAITVAAIFKRVPQRVGQDNRVANPQDIVWLWASTEPGAAMPGEVSLRAGRTGLAADGSLGPAYPRDRLDAGRYWWFVYALRAGRVVATSDVLSFLVGDDVPSITCSDVETCTRALPAGEASDAVACVGGRCRRRCASDVDCPGAGGRCAFEETVSATGRASIPRGAFCVVTSAM